MEVPDVIEQERRNKERLRTLISHSVQFRNARDRYDFMCCGAAVGVTAAFCAPIGGLLLVMESMVCCPSPAPSHE